MPFGYGIRNCWKKALSTAKNRSRRPDTDHATVDRVREAFQADRRASVRSAARSLETTRATFHKIPHFKLPSRPYKIQMLHKTEKTIVQKGEILVRPCSHH